MSIIRMETEKTRALVNAIRTAGNALRDSTSTIKTQVSTADWAGPAKDQFEDETIAAAQTMTQYMDQLEQLATALEQEITQWEDGAAVFGDGGIPSGEGAVDSSPSDYEKAIDLTNTTKDELFAAEEELNQAKAEYEYWVNDLMENEGMEDMNNITDMIHEAGITDPVLVDYLAQRLYLLKRLGDVTGIPALINAFKELAADRDLTTVDNIDLLVLAGEGIGEAVVGSIGAIWESIKESFRIGDAIGGAIVMDKKADAYLAAIDKYLSAQKNHKASWDNLYAAAPNN